MHSSLLKGIYSYSPVYTVHSKEELLEMEDYISYNSGFGVEDDGDKNGRLFIFSTSSFHSSVLTKDELNALIELVLYFNGSSEGIDVPQITEIFNGNYADQNRTEPVSTQDIELDINKIINIFIAHNINHGCAIGYSYNYNEVFIWKIT